MATDIKLSEFQRTDAEALRTFLKTSWLETYTYQLGRSVAKSLISSLETDTFGGLISGEDERAYVAKEGTDIIGCIVSAARSNVLYIWGCYVLASHQRCGIGRRLMQAAIENKQTSVFAQLTVLKQSVPAQLFYQKLGFEVQKFEGFELIPGQIFPALILHIPIKQLEAVLRGKAYDTKDNFIS